MEEDLLQEFGETNDGVLAGARGLWESFDQDDKKFYTSMVEDIRRESRRKKEEVNESKGLLDIKYKYSPGGISKLFVGLSIEKKIEIERMRFRSLENVMRFALKCKEEVQALYHYLTQMPCVSNKVGR